MLALPVVKNLDVFKGGSLELGMRRVVNPCSRSFLKRLNPLSVGALSQQFPFRLIGQVMPYALSLS